MKKKFFILLALLGILAVLALAYTIQPIKMETVDKPLDICTAPYDWGVCQDWTYKGFRIDWGQEVDHNFVFFGNLEDWHLIEKGGVYERTVKKVIMIQSSLFKDWDKPVGDCVGWLGACYKYSEVVDTFSPSN